jgi:hypothetical protein
MILDVMVISSPQGAKRLQPRLLVFTANTAAKFNCLTIEFG